MIFYFLFLSLLEISI